MNALTIVTLLFNVALFAVAYLVIAWCWRHRERPEPMTMNDVAEEANRTMHQAFADVGRSMCAVMPPRDLDKEIEEAIQGMKEAIKEERERVHQAGYQVGLTEPEHVDVAALFESMRRRFHLDEEDDLTEEDYLDGQREGEQERQRRAGLVPLQQLDLFP
jgi:hypothetical protein